MCVFLHLEVGNAVAQQPASLRPSLIDMHIVADAGELLRAGEARRPRSDDRDFLAGPHRWRLGPKSFRYGAVGDLAFDRFDGNRVLVDVERARGFARRRAHPTGDFRKIVGRMQIARRFVPVAGINEIVPVRDLVVDWAAWRPGRERARALAIGHAAIHATRCLGAVVRLGQRLHKFVPMANPLLDRLIVAVFALVFEKAGYLAHFALYCAPTRRPAWRWLAP